MQLWMYESAKAPKTFNNTGVYDAEVPPVLIPNTEVKLCSAESTWLDTAWEDMSMPVPKKKGDTQKRVWEKPCYLATCCVIALCPSDHVRPCTLGPLFKARCLASHPNIKAYRLFRKEKNYCQHHSQHATYPPSPCPTATPKSCKLALLLQSNA